MLETLLSKRWVRILVILIAMACAVILLPSPTHAQEYDEESLIRACAKAVKEIKSSRRLIAALNAERSLLEQKMVEVLATIKSREADLADARARLGVERRNTDRLMDVLTKAEAKYLEMSGKHMAALSRIKALEETVAAQTASLQEMQHRLNLRPLRSIVAYKEDTRKLRVYQFFLSLAIVAIAVGLGVQ